MNRRNLLRGFAAVPVAAPSAHGPPVSLPKRDCRSTQFEVAVAFGEGTTAGGTATLCELCFRSFLDSLCSVPDVAQALDPITGRAGFYPAPTRESYFVVPVIQSSTWRTLLASARKRNKPGWEQLLS